METGRIEMANANQPFNYDEDLSEKSLSGDEGETLKHVIYLTTNMLTPAKQKINEISVDTLNGEQILEAIKNCYSDSEQQKLYFKVFDPKDHLLPFKNKGLPASLLSA
jgi:hypothetical protein